MKSQHTQTAAMDLVEEFLELGRKVVWLQVTMLYIYICTYIHRERGRDERYHMFHLACA